LPSGAVSWSRTELTGSAAAGQSRSIRRPTSTCTGLDSASLGEFWRNNGSDVLKGVSQAVRDNAALGMRQLPAYRSHFRAKCIVCGKCAFSMLSLLWLVEVDA
jgi:hypothetical protein